MEYYHNDNQNSNYNNSNSQQYNNRYLITNRHSCKLIHNDITEYTPITHEIAKAIDILWKGNAIANTFELGRKYYNWKNSDSNGINVQNKNANNNNDSNGNRNRSGNMIDGVFREYLIDIEFCEYYMSNIFDYEQEKESHDELASTVIFNHKHWKDYKLLKRHILNQNPKTSGLCHANNNALIYFRMPWYACFKNFHLWFCLFVVVFLSFALIMM